MMATTVADNVPRYARAAIESLGPEDFETASIRSAAPSYTSDAPSYHSTNPNPDPLPPYSPPARPNPSSPTNTTAAANRSVSSLLDPNGPPSQNPAGPPRRSGLPPVPSGPSRRQPDLPSLSQFRIPPWSSATSASANPTARIYQNVALRRASAASAASSDNSMANLEGLMRRGMLERIDEEERNYYGNRVRPLEDPYLVGEEAAARARAERLARESFGGSGSGRGDEILIREDRRWDLFLAQMKDREERERGWRRLRRDFDNRSNGRLVAFRIGARF